MLYFFQVRHKAEKTIEAGLFTTLFNSSDKTRLSLFWTMQFFKMRVWKMKNGPMCSLFLWPLNPCSFLLLGNFAQRFSGVWQYGCQFFHGRDTKLVKIYCTLVNHRTNQTGVFQHLTLSTIFYRAALGPDIWTKILYRQSSAYTVL